MKVELMESARAVLCLAQLALLVGATALSCETTGPTLAPQAPEIFLTDIATDETDPCDLADSEPSLAVNPNNNLEIVALTFAEGWGPHVCKKTEDQKDKAPIWKSLDGGLTWEKKFVIPQTRTIQFGPYDQVVSFDRSGKLFIAAMDEGGNSVIYTENDAGVLVASSPYGQDQPVLDLDRTSTSKCFGRIYSAWSDTDHQPNSISMVSNSQNPTHIENRSVGFSDFPNRTARIAIGPDGTVYAIYKTQEGAIDDHFESVHFRLVRSSDCGSSWEKLDTGGVSLSGSNLARTWFTRNDGDGFGNQSKGKTNRSRSSDAWITVNGQDGTVYVAFVNTGPDGVTQIHIAVSKDRGDTWSITHIPNEKHHSAFPEIAVAENGAVGVLYVDFDDSGTTTVFRHLFARSHDGGATWDQKVLQTMDLLDISNDEPDFIWGDYEGLIANGNTFYGVFTGESINRTNKQLDPIFFKISATQ
jgi:hypothetical protein